MTPCSTLWPDKAVSAVLNPVGPVTRTDIVKKEPEQLKLLYSRSTSLLSSHSFSSSIYSTLFAIFVLFPLFPLLISLAPYYINTADIAYSSFIVHRSSFIRRSSYSSRCKQAAGVALPSPLTKSLCGWPRIRGCAGCVSSGPTV